MGAGEQEQLAATTNATKVAAAGLAHYRKRGTLGLLAVADGYLERSGAKPSKPPSHRHVRVGE
jgi:hypothetical protein